MGPETATPSVLAGPLQGLKGVTLIVPFVDPTVTVTEFVVPPAVCVHPAGNVHVYDTPGTFVTL